MQKRKETYIVEIDRVGENPLYIRLFLWLWRGRGGWIEIGLQNLTYFTNKYFGVGFVSKILDRIENDINVCERFKT